MEQFKREKELKRKIEEQQEIEMKPKLEEIYEPEKALEENDFFDYEIKDEAKVIEILFSRKIGFINNFSHLQVSAYCLKRIYVKQM